MFDSSGSNTRTTSDVDLMGFGAETYKNQANKLKHSVLVLGMLPNSSRQSTWQPVVLGTTKTIHPTELAAWFLTTRGLPGNRPAMVEADPTFSVSHLQSYLLAAARYDWYTFLARPRSSHRTESLRHDAAEAVHARSGQDSRIGKVVGWTGRQTDHSSQLRMRTWSE